ncbi:SH3 domain-containing protein, partial [Chryseobacterium sp. AG844]
EKNSSSQILEKINTGEEVEVLDQNGDWWLVVSKAGKKGYVHKSRIKSE